MKFTNKIKQILFMGICIIIFSCSELFLTEIELSETDCLNGNIECTYLEHVKPIFDANCISCHEYANDTNGNLSLSSYSNILSGDNNGSIINNNLENNLLYQKITGNQVSNSQMPPSGLMTPYNIDVIAKWIQGGAIE
jgi:hypothetical protein